MNYLKLLEIRIIIGRDILWHPSTSRGNNATYYLAATCTRGGYKYAPKAAKRGSSIADYNLAYPMVLVRRSQETRALADAAVSLCRAPNN